MCTSASRVDILVPHPVYTSSVEIKKNQYRVAPCILFPLRSHPLSCLFFCLRLCYHIEQVSAGLECGIGVDDFSDWEVGDIIEAFNSVQKNRTLEEASASMVAALEEAGIER